MNEWHRIGRGSPPAGPWSVGSRDRQQGARRLRALRGDKPAARPGMARRSASAHAAARLHRSGPRCRQPRPSRRQGALGPAVTLDDFREIWVAWTRSSAPRPASVPIRFASLARAPIGAPGAAVAGRVLCPAAVPDRRAKPLRRLLCFGRMRHPSRVELAAAGKSHRLASRSSGTSRTASLSRPAAVNSGPCLLWPRPHQRRPEGSKPRARHARRAVERGRSEPGSSTTAKATLTRWRSSSLAWRSRSTFPVRCYGGASEGGSGDRVARCADRCSRPSRC